MLGTPGCQWWMQQDVRDRGFLYSNHAYGRIRVNTIVKAMKHDNVGGLTPWVGEARDLTGARVSTGIMHGQVIWSLDTKF